MIKLFRNCDIYTPAHFGRGEILVEGGRITAVAKDLSDWLGSPGISVYDAEGATVCPGLIDAHVHVTGGGGEQGPTSRPPELQLTDFTMSGVTSLVGLLGTDGVSRSLENLLFKCRALEEEGLSTWMLTGNYRYPTETLTGDVERDIVLIDKIIGVKIAVSDHRSSAITAGELARLGTEARIGGMLSGKSGIVVMHMGSAERRLETVFEALKLADIPAATFVPTHCCRTDALIKEAVRLNKEGAFIDFTADMLESAEGVAVAVSKALRYGADASRVTISSDAGGSQPEFDDTGKCIGLSTGKSDVLLGELKRLVENEGLAKEDALVFFTKNPASLLNKTGVKGELKEGADADIFVLGENFKVKDLWAKGERLVSGGKPLVKGRFEI